jgi:branched-chain amino acid transport system ATP-binding protein
MLECRKLTVSFRGLKALQDLDLSVPGSSITSVVGSNGAGKTTLLRAISALERPTSGDVMFDGVSFVGRRADEVVKLGISHAPAGFQLFRNLTVFENLRLGAYVHGRSAAARRITDEQLGFVYRLFPVLQERALQAAGTLSGGQQQMVSIGRALMARPKLLLLDEPSLGLAPMVVEDILEALSALHREHGLAILLVEQNAHLALDFAEHVHLLENGRLIASGTAAAMKQSKLVAQAYLGV